MVDHSEPSNSNKERLRRHWPIFDEVQDRIKAFAIWKGGEAEYTLAKRGYSNCGELEWRPLMSYAWKLLAEREGLEIETPEHMLNYFRKQIEGRIKNLRRSAEAKTSHLVLVYDSTHELGPNTIRFDDDRLSEGAIAEEFKLVRGFEKYIGNQDPDPKLKPLLLRLLQISVDGVLKPQKQADELGVSVEYVTTLRSRLRAHYCTYTGIQDQVKRSKSGARK